MFHYVYAVDLTTEMVQFEYFILIQQQIVTNRFLLDMCIR